MFPYGLHHLQFPEYTKTYNCQAWHSTALCTIDWGWILHIWKVSKSAQVMVETKSQVGTVSIHDALRQFFRYPSHVYNMKLEPVGFIQFIWLWLKLRVPKESQNWIVLNHTHLKHEWVSHYHQTYDQQKTWNNSNRLCLNSCCSMKFHMSANVVEMSD